MMSLIDSTTGTDETLRRLLDEVVTTLRPVAVYLFGSRAEGRADAASDYDLMVVLKDDAPDAALDVVNASACGRRSKVPADIIPTTREVFLACRGNLSTLEGVAQARGKLVYGDI
jgi:uncharacterized protein